MSEYGRLWQQASDIRRALIERMPQGLPDPPMNTLPEAIRQVREHVDTRHTLLAQWADLEKKMSQEQNE